MIQTLINQTVISGTPEEIMEEFTVMIAALNDFLVKEVGMEEEKAKECIALAGEKAFSGMIMVDSKEKING